MDQMELQSEEQSELVTEGLQIVSFSLSGSRFALMMTDVQEIVRVPDTVKVPLSSHHLSGLANLRGRVLPIFQSRTLLGMDSLENNESSRVLVLRLDHPIGLVVDRVHSVMNVLEADIDRSTYQGHEQYAQWIGGMIKHAEGLITILDVHKLIESELQAEVGRDAAGALSIGLQSQQAVADEDSVSDELQLVSFEVAGQEYAAAINRVQEIVQAPVTLTTIPNAPSGVLGVMVLRARLLPLVSLRILFGLPAQSLDESQRVVVLQFGGGQSVGVVMDRVNEVLRVPLAEVEEVPSIFHTQGQVRHLASMCRLNAGRRLVSILNVDSVMSYASACVKEVEQDLSQGIEMAKESHFESADSTEDEGQVVVFRLGSEEFGVNIHSVQEIVRVPELLTKVPQSPDFLEGVINLRGSVLPVIDQRTRMGMAQAERSDRQRIMVYLMDGVRTGFIVDSVTEVLRLDPQCMSDTPVEGLHSAALIPKVANLPNSKRMILLIDHKALLSTHELQDVASSAGVPVELRLMDDEPVTTGSSSDVTVSQEVMA